MGMYAPKDPYKESSARTSWIAGEKGRLKSAAQGGWNREMSARNKWNTGIGNIWTQASGAKTQIGDLDYTQSEKNLRSRIASSTSRAGTLSGLRSPNESLKTSWNVTLPWDPSKYGESGSSNQTWSASDIGLSGAMPSITGRSMESVAGQVSRNEQALRDLLSTGQTKRQEWGDYKGEQTRDLGALERSLTGYGTGVTRAALPGGRVYDDISTLGAEKAQTTAGIDNNLFAGDLGFGSRYTTVGTGLQDLIDKRVAEEKRITDYGKTLRTGISGHESSLGGYDITNKTEIDAMLQDLLTKTQGVRDFRSKLDFDFNPELTDIQTVATGGQKLLSDRTAEERRIEQAIRDYGSTAGYLKGRGGRLGTKNLSDIEAIEDEAAAERAGIGRFASKLPFDFSGVQTTLGEAETAAGAARTKRFSELDALKSAASPYGTTLGTTPLYDEAAMRRLLDKIGRGASDVTAYGAGAKAEEAMGAYKGQAQSVEDKLEQLAQKRTSLEQQAQSMLTGSRLGYTGVGQVGAAEGSLEALRAEIEKYQATQGEDELQRIMAQLQSERGRLEDAARTAASRPQGSPAAAGAYNFGLPGRMSPEEYLALVSRRRSRDEELYPGSFGSLV